MIEPPHRAHGLRLRLLSAAGVLLILAGWAVASLATGAFFLPPPWLTVADTARLLADGFTWTQILITLLRVCAGFCAGFLTGLAAGIAIGSKPEWDALFKPLVLFFQGMPPLLWTIPLVALMGIGHVPTIIVIGLITFPLVAVTIGEGMSTLPRELGEMLAIFAPGFRPRMRELVLPHLKPFLGASLKAGLVLAVKASVTAEYFGANNGIGFQIQASYMSLRIRSLFSWAAVLILIILVFNHLLPRIRLAGPFLRRAFLLPRAAAPLPEESGELRRQFSVRPEEKRISVQGLSFAYAKGPEVLRNVSLEIEAGEIGVVTGQSGIGKTTLLKLVASLEKPTRGSISRPARIGFVFQDDRLLPWRTVVENAALPLLYGGYSAGESLAFASYLLGQAGMAGEEMKKPQELSGGMKKRAALARCFARLPDAILLDEPFSGLHDEGRVLLWDMFLRLLALHPVPTLIVTHYPEEISALAPCRLLTLEGKPARIIAAAGEGRS
ncbi:MAG: ATP-binding cassette domain-containing protein [Spirochaetia bacterium]|jgi:ABC-type nitrate/sulfonate/bicarbonate transport system ATPase subunit/ABC-type nitrate/sulfonate/bicarbonate transport system permease component